MALLSFAIFGSTPHPLADKVRRAVELIRSRHPDFAVDGEMQADTAVVSDIGDNRYPFSQVKDANMLAFPSLPDQNNPKYDLNDQADNIGLNNRFIHHHGNSPDPAYHQVGEAQHPESFGVIDQQREQA